MIKYVIRNIWTLSNLAFIGLLIMLLCVIISTSIVIFGLDISEFEFYISMVYVVLSTLVIEITYFLFKYKKPVDYFDNLMVFDFKYNECDEVVNTIEDLYV